ncbi:uncharacterized protein LAESUDRAFT_715597 [Laetiporus sulphureus 93-53]|uniref:Uncharacterized protein n=1 Tax=Laetiporus sulphureus 93-53 TaxID=1314785 RepID=A0A165D6N1_9APHY|nr:uncharacterized protein LAESUDRAFT_715597 [Laetiporus sulphureus 93-53]KZT04251.1 hypothetical protein LAESUDRAFT_715597 [Laetiporus sulphureus 93-53]
MAIEHCKIQLHSWFRNRSAKAQYYDGGDFSIKFNVGPSGATKLTEQLLRPKQTLTVIKSLIDKSFAEGDDSIKAEIQAKFEVQLDICNEDGEGLRVMPMPAAWNIHSIHGEEAYWRTHTEDQIVFQHYQW